MDNIKTVLHETGCTLYSENRSVMLTDTEMQSVYDAMINKSILLRIADKIDELTEKEIINLNEYPDTLENLVSSVFEIIKSDFETYGKNLDECSDTVITDSITEEINFYRD